MIIKKTKLSIAIQATGQFYSRTSIQSHSGWQVCMFYWCQRWDFDTQVRPGFKQTLLLWYHTSQPWAHPAWGGGVTREWTLSHSTLHYHLLTYVWECNTQTHGIPGGFPMENLSRRFMWTNRIPGGGGEGGLHCELNLVKNQIKHKFSLV